MESIIILEKPMARVALPDWHGKVWELRQTCDTRRNDALNLRNESRTLRNETEITTNWGTHHNNVRLKDRLTEIINWKNMMESCVIAIDKEIDLLKKEKSLTENEIEFLGLNFSMVNECLTQRDQRGGADLCTDEAEIEIKHEYKMLEGLKQMLTQKCQSAWEQVNRLDEIKFNIVKDLEEKAESIAIDTDNIGLDRHGSNICYKPNALRISSRMVPYETWLDHSRNLIARADGELEAAQKLRESLYVPREMARNDLKAQNETTNYALRKRIFETQRIKNELDWQRLNMSNDMEKLVKEISQLEASFLNKANAKKLAETRCENRMYKHGVECCRDEPYTGLIAEITQMNKTCNDLKQQLNLAKATYNALEEQLIVIDRELNNKNYALNTDLRCLDLRNKLVIGDRAPPNNQTDRNITLTRMEDEIPPE